MEEYSNQELVDFIIACTWSDPRWKYIEPDERYRKNAMKPIVKMSIKFILDNNGSIHIHRDPVKHALQCACAFIPPNSAMAMGFSDKVKSINSVAKKSIKNVLKIYTFYKQFESVAYHQRQTDEAQLLYLISLDHNIDAVREQFMKVIIPLTQYDKFVAFQTDPYYKDILVNMFNFTVETSILPETNMNDIQFYVMRRTTKYRVPRPVGPPPNLIVKNKSKVRLTKAGSTLTVTKLEYDSNPKNEITKYNGKFLQLTEELEQIPDTETFLNVSIKLKYGKEELAVSYNDRKQLLYFGSHGFMFLRYVTHIKANKDFKNINITYGDREFVFSTDIVAIYEPFLRGLISYIKRIKRRRNIYELVNPLWTTESDIDDTIAIGYLKHLFPNHDYFISGSIILVYFNELCHRVHSHIKISKINFMDLIRRIMHIHLDDLWRKYSNDGKILNEQRFQQFLLVEQREKLDITEARKLMSHILGPHNNYFTEYTFAEYVSSELNDAFDYLGCGYVYQDMTKPLTSYWIASSHNTYIEGAQINSEASVEMYAIVLRTGCRCIEIDTWDGHDKTPNVTHGNANFTPVKLISVLKCIRDNAFVASCYPVIISLENHCDEQQRNEIAKQFIEIFGEMLEYPPEDKSGPVPSPHQLRRKILLKGSINGNGFEDLDKIIYFSTSKTPEGSFQMVSYEEYDAIKLDPLSTIERTKKQFIRTYPHGLRFDSTNYDPTAWYKGIQMVALNYQTYDDPMLCNLGKFKDNGSCGYILKPNNIISLTDTITSASMITIKLLEGRLGAIPNNIHQITIKIFRESKDPPFETLIDEPRTINNHYYHKVLLDDLQSVRVAVLEESIIIITFDAKTKDALYCAYPVKCLRSGYRVFPLSREGFEVPGCFILAKITDY